MMEANEKKWNIIYPVYINSKKTIAEGRRISASRACENPTVVEMYDCCNHYNIPCKMEEVVDADCFAEKQLMLHIAELVPKHHGRVKKQEASSSTTGQSSKSGKGGKKKR